MTTVRKHLVPRSRKQVYKGRNKRKYLAIHETANTSRGADAAAHARLQYNGNNRQASWNYQVDDTEIVQSYKDTDRTWHAGSSDHGLNSIAIEICVNSDGDYDAAFENAAALAASLRKKHKIPANRVISHKFITGKNCPTNMLGRDRWDEFVAKTNPASAKKPKVQKKSKNSKPLSNQWPHKALKRTNKHTTASHNAWVKLMADVGYTDSRLTVNIQRWLRDLGYYTGLIDGVFGPMTVRALQTFLVDKGLLPNRAYVDGIRKKVTIHAEIDYLNAQRQYYSGVTA